MKMTMTRTRIRLAWLAPLAGLVLGACDQAQDVCAEAAEHSSACLGQGATRGASPRTCDPAVAEQTLALSCASIQEQFDGLGAVDKSDGPSYAKVVACWLGMADLNECFPGAYKGWEVFGEAYTEDAKGEVVPAAGITLRYTHEDYPEIVVSHVTDNFGDFRFRVPGTMFGKQPYEVDVLRGTKVIGKYRIGLNSWFNYRLSVLGDESELCIWLDDDYCEELTKR